MGNCKIEGINDVSESLKEVKIDNNESNLMNELEGRDYKDKIYKKYRCHNNLRNSQNREYNSKIKNSLLGNKKLNLNNINEKISKEKEDYNDDELIIITPRIKNNNQYCDSNSNEITDEFTIKNETLVYVNDYINNKETEIKKYTNLKQNSNIHKIKGKVQRKKINKNSNIKSNQLNNNKKKKINNIAKNNIKINNNRKQNISKKQKYNSHIPNTNNLDNLTQEMPFVKIDEMEYHRINNKNNNDSKDFQMMNNLNQKTDNYMYKRKAKSKKNSKVFNKSYNNLLFNNFGINPLLDSFQISEIINANNNNPHSSTLQKQNIELKNLLFQQLPLMNSEIFLPNVERKTYKEDLEIQNNENQQANIKVPVFRKKTDFHIRNKSYNKYDFFNCNLTNDNCNDNNYFSLFNNSANLSINFIHNKFNKTAKNLNKVEPMINNKNILSDRNNKSCCNKKVNINKNSQNKKPQKKSNPYMNYNNFNNKKNQNKKIKNKSNIQKEKQNVLSTSRSYNNIFQADKNNNKCEFNNTNGNINNMLLPSEQYRDMVEKSYLSCFSEKQQATARKFFATEEAQREVRSRYKKDIEKFKTEMNGKAKKLIPLPVSGAFHSPLMQKAQNEIESEIEKLQIQAPKYKILQNFSGKFESEPSVIKKNLQKQITAPVLWCENMQMAIEQGFDTFIEIGAKNVLTGLLKRIIPEDKKERIKLINVEKVEDVKNLFNNLNS